MKKEGTFEWIAPRHLVLALIESGSSTSMIGALIGAPVCVSSSWSMRGISNRSSFYYPLKSLLKLEATTTEASEVQRLRVKLPAPQLDYAKMYTAINEACVQLGISFKEFSAITGIKASKLNGWRAKKKVSSRLVDWPVLRDMLGLELSDFLIQD